MPKCYIYLISIPGDNDPSALKHNQVECVSISAKRHLCLLYSSRCPLHLYCTMWASSGKKLAGRDGVLCADSHVRVDRHDVSAPSVPSESDDGGLYKDVFRQITHGKIYKNLHCLANRLSIRAHDPSVLVQGNYWTLKVSLIPKRNPYNFMYLLFCFLGLLCLITQYHPPDKV